MSRRTLPFLDPVRVTTGERAVAHLAAAMLLDYPTEHVRAHHDLLRSTVAGLPHGVAHAFRVHLDAVAAMDLAEQQGHYVATFDLRRRCALYLSYYSAGDTRRRGMALVTFREAYRACGFEASDDELPDFLPAVLELSARAPGPVVDALLGTHREGLELLRSALHDARSPYAHVLDAVCRTLPAVDAATAERFADLVASGPPGETVGLSAPLLPFPTVRPTEVPA
ncbi:nitrate reductase molybdenum cofactor assembly chaperone [Cellulomonas algicola]|uniref:nitrate reductase molybdenum cofactor assembly chaperone n=1 Tax=Cellulomonas algicola TaxID=2071633 RepID=UPI001C3FA8EC|nr:nitrate reductase molybdenum cofactor assembly chaperone [Cellulomonas algicola]